MTYIDKGIRCCPTLELALIDDARLHHIASSLRPFQPLFCTEAVPFLRHGPVKELIAVMQFMLPLHHSFNVSL